MRFLVVDDAPTVRMFFRLWLEEFGDAIVDEAGDGLQALKLLTQNPYDLVLLDIDLPLMHGLQLLSALRKRPETANTPAVIVSASSYSEETTEQAMRLGATAVAAKPMSAGQFRRLVAGVLGERTLGGRLVEPERRQSPRLQARVKISFSSSGGSDELETSDISPTGAFLRSERPPRVGERATATVHLPYLDRALVVDCVVVHVRAVGESGFPAGFGVQFQPTTAEERAGLNRAFLSPSSRTPRTP